jgi:tRNA pseudouridine13 synthase
MTDPSPHVIPAAYLSADIPGIGGVLRQRPEDFLVEEIPAYQPSGEGEHIYLFVQKRDLSTLQMVKIIAKHFGVRQSDVGYAGLKDKRAITRQVISVHAPGKKPEDFPSLQHDKVGILWTDLHTNKLRRGHLKGNRFSIRVRQTPISGAFKALKVLRLLEAHGVPNRLGAQRFGALLNNHLVGRAIVKGEWQAAVNELIAPADQRHPAGLPDPDHQRATRRLCAEGRFEEALSRIPYSAEPERAVLRALLAGKPPRTAILSIDAASRLFYLNALQSAVFNAILDQRLAAGTLSSLAEGDLAFKHDSGAVFAVDAALAADPETRARLDRLEISPSGPMWGAQMMRASGEVAQRELDALARLDITPDDLAAHEIATGDELRGIRRALRVPLTYPEVEAGADDHGPFVRCAFELPAGAFATTVMDEIMKPKAVDPDAEDAP